MCLEIEKKMSEKEAAEQNVLVLAYLGDSVYSLLTRTYLVQKGGRKAGRLHAVGAEIVSASSQAAAFPLIESELSEREFSVYRRAKNAHSTHTPKHMTEGDYHIATGLEAVFGYLYLSGQNQRIRQLYTKIIENFSE